MGDTSQEQSSQLVGKMVQRKEEMSASGEIATAYLVKGLAAMRACAHTAGSIGGAANRRMTPLGTDKLARCRPLRIDQGPEYARRRI
jgi:hypothetical protein